MNDSEPKGQVLEKEVISEEILVEQPSADVVIDEMSPLVESKDNSDKLPMVIKDEDEKYQEKIDQAVEDLNESQGKFVELSAIENLGDFLQRFVKLTTIEGETKNLNRLINTLMDNRGQIIEKLSSLRGIKRNRRDNDRDLHRYLQEKEILRLINRAANENSNIVAVLEEIDLKNQISIEQSSQIEISTIKDPKEREKAGGILTDNLAVQEAKGNEYKGMVNFFIQDRLMLTVTGGIVAAQFPHQESAIQAEYRKRAEDIKTLFEKSDFYRKRPSGHNIYNPNLFDYRRVLEEPFDIENRSKFPDHRISEHYLNFINTWIGKYLFTKEDNSVNVKKLFGLSKELIGNIDPDLQKDWMKEMVDLLDCVANKDRNFESKKKFIQKEAQVKLERKIGAKVEVPPLPNYITAKMLERFTNRGFELRFFPELDFGSLKEFQKIGVEEYIEKLRQLYPNLINPVPMDDEERYVSFPDKDNLYWDAISREYTDFPSLPGRWMAVQVGKKTIDERKYPLLIPNKDYEQNHYNAEKLIEENQEKILKEFGLTSGEVRMLTAPEWLLLYDYGLNGIRTVFDEWTKTKLNRKQKHKYAYMAVFRGKPLPETLSFHLSSELMGFRFGIVLPDTQVA